MREFPSSAPLRRGAGGKPMLLVCANGIRRQSKSAAKQAKRFFDATWQSFHDGKTVDYDVRTSYYPPNALQS